MPIESSFLPYRESWVEYRAIGTGPRAIVAFHGFGDQARLFDVLEEAVGDQATLYALSLPYHGLTRWQEGVFSPQDLIACIEKLLETKGIQQFSLLGYSMGGKIALNLIPHFAPKLERIFLLAPDGIATHPLYDIHGLPNWFIQFVKALMRWPDAFFRLAKAAHRYRFISKFLYDFTLNHFATKRQRIRFFQIARSLQAFKPHLGKIFEPLNKRNIPVTLFLGKRDEIIPPKVGTVIGHIYPSADIIFLDKGHLLIDPDLVIPFRQVLDGAPIFSSQPPN